MMTDWTTIGAQAKHKASGGRVKEDDMVDVNNSRDIINTKTVERRIVELSESLGILMKLRESFPGTPLEWSAGATLIKDEFFEDHVKQIVAEQLTESAWLLPHIDWPEAACSRLHGYLSINFEGVTYWVKKEDTPQSA
jgi:hypothetical protein